jgi:PAS domain S-box-containing protein
MDLSNTPSPVSPERDRLAALDRLGILDTAPEREFDDLTRLAAAALSVDSAAISLVDDHRQWFKARHGIPFSETSRNDAFCARVVDSGDMMVVTDAHLHPEFQNNPLVLGKGGIRFYVGIPIKSAGHCVGTLCVFDPKPRSGLTRKQTELLLELAKLATDLIESRRARRMGEITAKVVSATSDAIVAADGNGMIVFWNPAAETMFGYSSEDALGHFIDLFLLSNPDDGTLSRPLFPDPDGMAGVAGKFVEHCAVRANGDIFPVEMSLAPWGDIDPYTAMPSSFATLEAERRWSASASMLAPFLTMW